MTTLYSNPFGRSLHWERGLKQTPLITDNDIAQSRSLHWERGLKLDDRRDYPGLD